ncbi:SdiA-regulated domain-containing protein [Gelidibacter maritimus]|uniref:SdiA-regulated domain-containing protein n=1 Tax=Gelidibacter maritimus TaxID=2761487 RepID=A0A7W2M883_9FLAO|nr:SdiA-regulated domain-containing protein [Gelidibacter maritimus]MBA6154473.1 SdiA-regulated domain-containing protein [Gelidibacter maritimus]
MKKSSLFIGLFIAILVGIAIVGFYKVNQANAEITKGMDNYTILETWELPDALDEVSGIVWVDDNTLACVQDENGIIYVYDLYESSIKEEIPFAGNGDYEGIALNKIDLFVMRSDGLLYEINNWREANRTISAHETGFKSSHNMESLVYSPNDSSLLTAPKDKDSDDSFKGIYKISMTDKSVDLDAPTYKIDLNADALSKYRSKKLRKTFNPSEIAVHPITKDIYVLEGKNPKLMILDQQGALKTVLKLDEINFPQPEGMTFSTDGELYISNEAAGGSATIHLVEFKTS